MKDHDKDFDERHYYRDFWHDWREEQRHFEHDIRHEMRHGHGYMPQGMEEQQAWREFFHHEMGDWPEQHWIFGGRRFSPWQQGMSNFNPFVANLLSKGGGLLPLFVLLLLAQKPRYGNEVMEILADRTGGQWVSNPGAIYPLLALLERRGLIEGRWEDPSKRTIRIYTITDTGRQELERIKAIVIPKVRETVEVLQGLLKEVDSEGPTSGNTTDTSTESNTETHDQ
jgi:DNA-binding PadR family transcriptional regulator